MENPVGILVGSPVGAVASAPRNKKVHKNGGGKKIVIPNQK